VGYYALPDAPVDADYTAARAAVPEDLRRAVIQYAGHLYENREGQGGAARYEVLAKAQGLMPANVVVLLEPFRDWSLT
jgi:hypothetical protein